MHTVHDAIQEVTTARPLCYLELEVALSTSATVQSVLCIGPLERSGPWCTSYQYPSAAQLRISTSQKVMYRKHATSHPAPFARY